MRHLSRGLPRAAAEDCVAEAFARIQKLGTLSENLLWRVALNLANDWRRESQRATPMSRTAEEEWASEGGFGRSFPTIPEALFRADFIRAMAALPEQERQAFALTELRGLTQSETAHLLGISQPTTHRRVEAARTHLRKELTT